METDELETRCGRESRTQQKGPLGPPIEFWRPEVGDKLWRTTSSGERERHNADGHKSGGQYVAVLFGLQLPLTRNLSNKVRGIFF